MRWRSAALAGLLVLCVVPPGASEADEGTTRLARELGTAIGAFAATLDEDQRGAALYDFDDDERFDLRLAPLWLEGLRVSEMSDAQWHALRGAFEQVLSPQGLRKMEAIRSLEHELAEMEGGFVRFLRRRYGGARASRPAGGRDELVREASLQRLDRWQEGSDGERCDNFQSHDG